MTKIKNKDAYPVKIPVATDYIIGSDSENDGKTVNFQFDSFVDFINSINGTEIISYIFATTPIQVLDENGYGYFLSDNNIIDPTNITELMISKKTKSLIDLTPLYNFIDSHSDTFSLKLRNLSDPNNFIYFNILDITEQEFQFTFSVEVTDSDNFLGELEVDEVYGLEFNNSISISSTDDLPEGSINLYFTTARVLSTILTGVSFVTGGSISSADTILSAFGKIQKQINDLSISLSLKLDKGGYSGTAQALKTDIDNIYQPDTVLRTTPPTRVSDTFTFPSVGYDVLLSKVIKTNTSQLITTINAATTDFKRTDLIYFKPDNTLDKLIGTESITVAQRPDVPAGCIALYFINIFGTVVSPPVPIDNLISIQDVYGTPWFNVKDYVRFEGVSFNSSQKLISINPLAPFTAYVDRNIGDDATGEIGNYVRKFKTIDGVFNRFGFNLSANQAKNLIVQILTSGDYPINGQVPLTNIEFRSNNTVNIDTSANTFAPTNSGLAYSLFGKYSDLADPVKNIYFNIPNGSYTHNNLINDISWAQAQTNIVFNINSIYINAKVNNFFLANIISYQKNLTKVSTNITFNLSPSINELAILGNLKLVTNFNISIAKVTGTGTFTYGAATSQTAIITIGDITVTGQTLCSGGGTTITEFRQSKITNNFVLGENNVAGINIFRGTVLSVANMFANFLSSLNLEIVFESFVGNLGAGASGHSIRLSGNGLKSFKIVNSTININGMLMNPLNLIKINIDNSTINQLTPNILLDGGNINTPLVISGLNTNALGLTNVPEVPVVFNSISFKEKRNEQVIRSKYDLINRVLDSNITYVIDGTLTLLTAEYIQVPAGGLTINGYGFTPSSIKKNVSGQSIFTSPVGGSGDLVSINISYYPGVGSVFNIVDSSGVHAIELDKVNFQGVTGSSLGVFNGYRQFTGTTCGFYSLSDGLTLEGNWSGFKLTNSNVIGFGATGTLFKKGTTTVFSNRFYIDLNIQISTGSKICDFAPVNLTNDKSLQVVNCYNKVNGVIDDTTTSITFPNITPYSSKSYFVNNIGIKNSNNMPYGISTGNMQAYADDSAAAAGGIVAVGDTYIETSTGYFKKRLT